jgi:hypothetical protein
MKKFLIIIALFATSANSVFAQSRETRSLSDFSEISVGEAIEVTLVAGNKNEAVISAGNIDLEDVITDVRGNRLKIELEGTRHRNIDVEITLTYISIDVIRVSSAADVETKGPIKVNRLNISVSSAGSAELEIEGGDLDIDISSSGVLVLSGRAVNQRVEVSSAGQYQGYDLECEDSYARVSSAGSARINATKKIDAKASSAGSIKYKGNPDKVYISSSSGGHAGKSY